jgi:hypothetical protein
LKDQAFSTFVDHNPPLQLRPGIRSAADIKKRVDQFKKEGKKTVLLQVSQAHD